MNWGDYTKLGIRGERLSIDIDRSILSSRFQAYNTHFQQNCKESGDVKNRIIEKLSNSKEPNPTSNICSEISTLLNVPYTTVRYYLCRLEKEGMVISFTPEGWKTQKMWMMRDAFYENRYKQ